GRGRRRAVEVTPIVGGDTVCALPLKQQQQQQQQVHSNNVEVLIEDRSLTGWGKTTRRPRRQRCPAGNPALLVPLT
ncbi:DUF863 domain-containing protein, partial [Vibrio vulnificus]|nr:DUF863 domain-containing protein [Vibrio vulnificus]